VIDVWDRVVWSKPQSPRPSLCSLCFGGVEDVPLMLWKADGSCAQFCRECETLIVPSLQRRILQRRKDEP
jgi:hypothetical protein